MIFLSCLVLLVSSAFAGDIISLTSINKDELSKHPIALVKYYTPWCGHCKALAPHFEKAATMLKDNKPPVTLLEVNCDNEAEICSKAGVSGYPTLKIYNDGVESEVFGRERTTDGIVSFMKARAGPASEEFSTAEAFNELISRGQIVISIQTDDKEAKKEFMKVARLLRAQLKFAHTSEKILDSSKATVLTRTLPPKYESKLEETRKYYDGEINSLAIQSWISENAVGLVGIRTIETESFFERPLLTFYSSSDFERDPSGFRYHRNRMLKAAKELDGKVRFAMGNAKDLGHELHEIGVDDKINESPMVIISSLDGKHYVMEGKFGVAELKKFVNDFTSGSLTPFIKSEPIPDEQTEATVKVVGKTFEDIVTNSDKDVLIEFYAPWCGHCKALKPKFEELATKLSKESGVTIAAIDATANSFPPHFKVQGFPTIYWVPKNAKNKPVSYDGERDVEAMLGYVAKSATDDLEYFTRDGKAKHEEL